MYRNNQAPIIPPQKPRTLRRILLIIGVVLIAIGVGLHVYKLVNAPTCFTADDYVEFYGASSAGTSFAPGAEFFRGSYSYTPGTTALDTSDSDATPAKDAAALATFYAKHSGKHATFIIETPYSSSSEDTTKSIAEKRASDIKQLLVNAGIPAEMIQTKSKAYNLSDETIEYDATDAVSLTLASTDSCRE